MSGFNLFDDREFPPFAFGRKIDESDAELDDYIAVGKLVVAWAKDPASAPKSMDEFREAVSPHMTIDAKYKRFRIEQADNETAAGLEFVLRLPPAGQVKESEDRLKGAPGGTIYPLPNFYVEVSGVDEPIDAFYGRVADYTMRSCR